MIAFLGKSRYNSGKLEISSKEETDTVLKAIQDAEYVIKNVKTGVKDYLFN